MPEASAPIRSIPLPRPGRLAGGLAVALLLALGVARIPLEDDASIESLRRGIAEQLGAEVRLGSVRLDLLGAGGVVLRDAVVEGPGWRLALDRAVWRPRPLGLVDGGPGSALSAHGFELSLEPAALAPPTVPVPVSRAALPALRLRDGRVTLPDGRPLLDRVDLDARGARRLELSARQRGGGRLDLRGRPDADGALELDLFPESLALDGLGARLAGALPAPNLVVGGHWNARLEDSGRHAHRFDLELRAAGPEIAAGQSDPLPRLRLRARGRFGAGPDPELADAGRFEPGSHVVVEGEARGFASPAGALPRLRVSGPIQGNLALSGRPRAPHLQGTLVLDDAHLRVGSAVRKPCGVRARLRFDSQLEELEDPARTTYLALDLGALRAVLLKQGSGAFEGSTGWVPLDDLARWMPAAEERATGGRVRLARVAVRAADSFDADLEFEGAAFEGRRSPLPLTGLTGSGHLSALGFRAEGAAAAIAGVPVRLDVAALRSELGAAPRMRFAVRAEEIDLGDLPPRPPPADAPPGPLPLALVAAAEPPVALLRRRRESLAQVEVEAGRFEVGRLRAGDAVLRDVKIDLALSALRLQVSQLAFRQAGRHNRFAGSIDLDQLVPEIEFASLP